MLDALSFQDRFAEMLDGADEAVTPWLSDPTHIARLRVYRNNVVTAWADTIVKNYPAVERLVGTDFMRGAVIAFVRAHPPQSPVLSLYGEGFAEFLETFTPAASLPYLPDVARLDRAWTSAFFASNAVALAPQNLADRSDAEIAALTPGLHPSASLLVSKWNAFEIWKANRVQETSGEIQLRDDPSAAIVWWAPEGVSFEGLSSLEWTFLNAIQDGASFGDALELTSAHGAHADAIAFFSQILARGVFASV